MDKNNDKRHSFFKETPKNLYKLIDSVGCKIYEAPFSLLTSKINRDYADLIVNKCGVTEEAVHKILKDSFEPDSIIIEAVGVRHGMSEQGEAIFKGYTKAIEALKKVTEARVIIDDTAYNGYAYGRAKISLREALNDEIEFLKEKRARWARLFMVHPELKGEPISKTATGMFTNQAYNIFIYIKKCHDKAGYKTENVSIYELISDLFMAIYDHPAFQAGEIFTPDKIKEYCDNGPRQRKLKKTKLRKSLESL